MDLTALSFGAVAGSSLAGAVLNAAGTTGDVAPYSLIGTVVTPLVVLGMVAVRKLHFDGEFQDLKVRVEAAEQDLKDERKEREVERNRLIEYTQTQASEMTTQVVKAVTRNAAVVEANSALLARHGVVITGLET